MELLDKNSFKNDINNFKNQLIRLTETSSNQNLLKWDVNNQLKKEFTVILNSNVSESFVLRLVYPTELDNQKSKPKGYNDLNGKEEFKLKEDFNENEFNFISCIEKNNNYRNLTNKDYIIANIYPIERNSLLFLPNLYDKHPQYLSNSNLILKALIFKALLYLSDVEELKLYIESEKKINKNSLTKNNIILRYQLFRESLVGYNSKGAESSVNNLHFQAFFLDSYNKLYTTNLYNNTEMCSNIIDNKYSLKEEKNQNNEFILNLSKSRSNKNTDISVRYNIDKSIYFIAHDKLANYIKSEDIDKQQFNFNIDNYIFNKIDLKNLNSCSLYLVSYEINSIKYKRIEHLSINENIVDEDSEKLKIHKKNNTNKINYFIINYNCTENFNKLKILNKKTNKLYEFDAYTSILILENDFNVDNYDFFGLENIASSIYYVINKLNKANIPYNILFKEEFAIVIPRKNDKSGLKLCFGMVEFMCIYVCYTKQEYNAINPKDYITGILDYQYTTNELLKVINN